MAARSAVVEVSLCIDFAAVGRDPITVGKTRIANHDRTVARRAGLTCSVSRIAYVATAAAVVEVSLCIDFAAVSCDPITVGKTRIANHDRTVARRAGLT